MNEPIEPTEANNQGVPISAEQPEAIAKLLDALPGFIGGLDHAIRDQIGQPMPFVLLIFSGNNVAHAQNFDAKAANAMVKAFAASLEKDDE